MVFCHSVEVYRRKKTSPWYFWYVLIQQLSMKSYWKSGYLKELSMTYRERSCFTKHDSWSNFSNIFRNDYMWLRLFQGDWGISVPIKILRELYVSFTYIGWKKFYLLHSQNFSSGFGLEIILQKLGDIFKIYFRPGTGNITKSFSLLFHLVYIHLIFKVCIHLIYIMCNIYMIGHLF